MASWFGWMKRKKEGKEEKKLVLDGSEITELVGNKEAFGSFVDHKFEELDRDHDGKLSVSELQPAVATIGAALGLPAQGSSLDSDNIYSEVLNEFTHGKQEEVSKSEFKEVLSDILLGVAAGLKRDPIVILRIDGEDLKEFVESLRFEPEVVTIFSQFESTNASLRNCIMKGLKQLTVEYGMPPASDSWVISEKNLPMEFMKVLSNIIEPAIQLLPVDHLEQPATQEIFFEEFNKLVVIISERLQEQPVIVAHSENTFDGSGIKRLFSNKFELDKLLDEAWKDLPKDPKAKVSKEHLRVALVVIAPSANLPPFGAVAQVDAVVNEAIKMINADDGKTVHEKEFKKLMMEILGSIMLQLQGNPIFVSSNSVVHEPMASCSTLLPSISEQSQTE